MLGHINEGHEGETQPGNRGIDGLRKQATALVRIKQGTPLVAGEREFMAVTRLVIMLDSFAVENRSLSMTSFLPRNQK